MNEQLSDVAALPAPSGLSRDERRIKAAQDVLRTAIRDYYLAHFRGDELPPGVLDIHLHLRVNPRAGWELEFNPPVYDQLHVQLADQQASRDIFEVGHVYCFRCESSVCEHSNPSTSLQVFKGYDATGRPEWHEFVQALIEEKDERVDQLFRPGANLFARFQLGRTLKGRQLTAFGKASLSYSILGQVIAGYFEHHHERAAVTLQVVEGRTAEGNLSLRLNPVSHGIDGRYLVEWLSSGSNHNLFRAIQIAERELGKIEQHVIAARVRHDQTRANQLMGRVPAIMRRLAETIERGGRQEDRRTHHVENRRQDQRPVHKAFDDAAAAMAASCFYDEKAKTFVVVSERGRAHAFNGAGRHVTSFVVKPSAVSFRIRTERWRRVESGEWTEFKRSLQRRELREEK